MNRRIVCYILAGVLGIGAVATGVTVGVLSSHKNSEQASEVVMFGETEVSNLDSEIAENNELLIIGEDGNVVEGVSESVSESASGNATDASDKKSEKSNSKKTTTENKVDSQSTNVVTDVSTVNQSEQTNNSSSTVQNSNNSSSENVAASASQIISPDVNELVIDGNASASGANTAPSDSTGGVSDSTSSTSAGESYAYDASEGKVYETPRIPVN